MNSLCELQAIVVSSDATIVSSILPCLEDLGIAPSVHALPASALQMIAREKVDAFFVDHDADPELSVLKRMRVSPSSRAAVGFAIVPLQSSIAIAPCVADFQIHKPFEAASVSRAVRVAYGLMLKERRRYFRYPLRIHVDLRDSTYRKFLGHTINLSQTGVALECVAPLTIREIVQLQFRLPAADHKMKCHAQIIWTAEQGKAGLAFTKMKSSHREELTGWIEDQFHRLWHMPNAKDFPL